MLDFATNAIAVNEELGKNVRDDLEEVIGSDVDFGGTFSFQADCRTAPNPWLSLAKLGTVGLPLSVRDAAAIKAEAKQAPFGKGERTIVDKNVRDTWEMDASEVTIENPDWQGFIDQTVPQICRALGLDFAAVQPRCELYKLLLYEEGSHFLPHVDTEKTNGMFATMIVVLPSAYTGGAAHLSHNGQSVVYDCSKNSKNTNVMAWYTDIMHEIKPVESGYRLALSYNLIRTTRSLRPPVQSNAAMTAALDRILQSWKEDPHAPTKIIYRLDHSYSQANLNGSALKGRDAQRVAILHPIVEKHGFKLGLAQLTCHLAGIWDEENDGYNTSDGLEKRFIPDSVSTEEAEITNLVDLEGHVVLKQLDYWMGDETIPFKLGHGLEHVEPDSEDWQEFTGNDGGDLDRWYHRCVLVIWPAQDDFSMQYMGKAGLSRAYMELSPGILAHNAPARTPHVDKLVGILLGHCEIDDWDREEENAKVLCLGALAWDDPELWCKTAKKCGNFIELPDEYKWSAIEKWGFSAVQEGFTLEHDDYGDPYGKPLAWLLKFIEWLAKSEPSVHGYGKTASTHHIKSWVTARVRKIINQFDKKEPYPSHCTDLVRLIGACGGMSLLEDSHVLGRITGISNAYALEEIARKLSDSKDIPDCEGKTTIITTVMAKAIKCAFLITRPSRSKPLDPSTLKAHKYVRKCLSLHQECLISLVLNNIAEGILALEAEDDSEEEPLQVQYARASLSPLVVFWTTDEAVITHAFEELESLRTLCIDILLNSFAKTLNEVDFEALLAVAIKNGQTALLISLVVPRLREVLASKEPAFEATIEKLTLANFGVDEIELRHILQSVFHLDESQTGSTRPPMSPEHKAAPAQKKRRTGKK